MASWYGGKFQGRQTANGETFDTNKLTAAHKSLPFDTIVKVTNLLNNRSVRVRINDRGPFIAGRIIDLSRAAADAIDMTGRGIAPVIIEPVEEETGGRVGSAKRSEAPRLYTIQVGAFGVAANARRAKIRIEEHGLTATIVPVETGILRVLVTDVAEEELAAAKQTLKEAGFTGLLVRRKIS